jgi:hypothetical protein
VSSSIPHPVGDLGDNLTPGTAVSRAHAHLVLTETWVESSELSNKRAFHPDRFAPKASP